MENPVWIAFVVKGSAVSRLPGITGRLAQFRYRMLLLPDGLRSSAIECLCYRTANAVPLSNDSAAKKLTSPLERQYIFEAGKLF